MILKNYLLRYTFLLFISYNISAQVNSFNGKILDSLQNPIPNTNIIATPLVENADITFAISSLDGEYKLKLQHNLSYQIAITHLGYKKINNTCKKPQKTFIFEYIKQHTQKI